MAEKASLDGLARNTYFDPTLQRAAVKLLPGEYHVTDKDLVQVTVLGSCVSACIRDTNSGIGGMNHFMLPDAGSGEADQYGSTARYGVNAMELLINSLLKLGARRHNLEAKVFGGGNVMRTLNHSSVGTRNSKFVIEYLDNEKIRVVARDLEDIYPRKIYFFPHDGKVRVRKLLTMHNRTIIDREADYTTRLRKTADTGAGGDIELFA